MNRYQQAKGRHRKTWAQRPVEWIKTTIAEPFPVFYSHVSQNERRAGLSDGPHYSAGSSWDVPFTEQNWTWKQASAEGLRQDGYTVTVTRETRPTYCFA